MTEIEKKELLKIITDLNMNWDKKTKNDIKNLIDVSRTPREFVISLIIYASSKN